jgi:hypothetical protein
MKINIYLYSFHLSGNFQCENAIQRRFSMKNITSLAIVLALTLASFTTMAAPQEGKKTKTLQSRKYQAQKRQAAHRKAANKKVSPKKKAAKKDIESEEE